jgi:hypothetical protein
MLKLSGSDLYCWLYSATRTHAPSTPQCAAVIVADGVADGVTLPAVIVTSTLWLTVVDPPLPPAFNTIVGDMVPGLDAVRWTATVRTTLW